MKVYNRLNTPHQTFGKSVNQMTMSLTRRGFIQISKAAVEALFLKEGDGLVLLEDEQYDDFYLACGDANRGAFYLAQVGHTARLGFTCSGIAEILAKRAIAPQDWGWMVLNLFQAPEGRLGIDLKHPKFPKRGSVEKMRSARKPARGGAASHEA